MPYLKYTSLTQKLGLAMPCIYIVYAINRAVGERGDRYSGKEEDYTNKTKNKVYPFSMH